MPSSPRISRNSPTSREFKGLCPLGCIAATIVCKSPDFGKARLALGGLAVNNTRRWSVRRARGRKTTQARDKRCLNLPNSFAELQPAARILLGPGPSNIHPRVMKAMLSPMVGYLDPDFVRVMED